MLLPTEIHDQMPERLEKSNRHTKDIDMKVNALIKIDQMILYDIIWNFDYG